MNNSPRRCGARGWSATWLCCFTLLSLIPGGCASRDSQVRRAFARQEAQTVRVADLAKDSSAYRVACGDGLRIEYFYNEELNRGVLVRSDGCITLPLIGDVEVADATLPEINRRLAKRYQGVLKNPTITVSLENVGGKVFVGGEVTHPGLFVMSSGVTALRAITMAGGALRTGALDTVVVVRDQGTAEPLYLLLDLKRGLNELAGGEDLRLQPKDMLYIPKTRIATVNQFVDQYMNQLIPFQKSLNVTYLFGQYSP